MKSKILAVLLLISILMNIYLIQAQPSSKDLLEMKDKINQLEINNSEMSKQIYRDNLSIQNYASQLDLYREKIAGLEGKINNTPSGLSGAAKLEAPAVMQKVDYIEDYPFVRQQITEIGSMMNISVEIKPGKGRVLVDTKPLMGVVFQDAANTAAYTAQKKTGKDLSGSDIIFSIDATYEVPSVDGPSAGALMTLLVVGGLNNLELRKDMTMTGTIDKDGHVGEIGGVIEKAKAAKDSGKNLILLPGENSRLIQYIEKTRNYYGITVIERVPETIDAKDYIEKNIGINVEYIDNLDDVLKYAT
ncbi:MAG: ATP-dependent protease [Candidatus Methanoperedens sp.]|uniref:S16 family serine protease n=1 Tax=Candidatus Methanoperedens sp. BLZ2 TaxID=2035255 RepID=UPI000BE44BB2|nr:S16 family serine protease [Candidatus Methanoperedens sp. BLZ2]KAB2947526.1 MAG: ATP-dependent protease [Candidatus Methanoperedens sp.]MBZ0173707.1 ATP-dependent protease [Candidatus Methanoperedens nitroreducens]MCX9078769.1 ATP-dependent protease [Candidatus Methanoperedens sp.]